MVWVGVLVLVEEGVLVGVAVAGGVEVRVGDGEIGALVEVGEFMAVGGVFACEAGVAEQLPIRMARIINTNSRINGLQHREARLFHNR